MKYSPHPIDLVGVPQFPLPGTRADVAVVALPDEWNALRALYAIDGPEIRITVKRKPKAMDGMESSPASPSVRPII